MGKAVLFGVGKSGGVGTEVAQGDLALAGFVLPGGHQFGDRRIEFEFAVVHEQRQRQARDRCLGQGSGSVLLVRTVAGRVPLVDDLVVADDEEGVRLALGQFILEGVEFLLRQALALRRDGSPFKWLRGRRAGETQ